MEEPSNCRKKLLNKDKITNGNKRKRAFRIGQYVNINEFNKISINTTYYVAN